MSKIKFYKDSAKTQQVYPELDPEDITKFESLEDIENAFPNVSGEDTNLTLNHTVEAPMRLELAPSELEQATTTGKNLLDYITNLISSGNGLTSVINEDGSITTTGKPTSNYSTIIKTIDITDILEDKSTYTISQSIPANLFVQINIRKLDGTLKYVNSNKGSSSFIVDKSIYSSYTLVIQTASMKTWGDSSLTITNKYMLCKGTDTSDTSFEPYTGGFPQPNPDFPSQVHSVSGDNEITVCGKNLSPVNSIVATGTTLTGGGVGGLANSVLVKDIPVKPNQRYKISLNVPSQVTETSVFFYNGKLNANNHNATYLEKVRTFMGVQKKISASGNKNDNYEYMAVTLGNKSTYPELSNVTVNVENIMVRVDGSEDNYEPYTGHTYPINLGDLEYCKIGTYSDEFFKNDPSDPNYDSSLELDRWYLKKNVGKIALDGSETISTTTYTEGAYYHNIINIGLNGTNNDFAMSNYYSYSSSYKNNTCKTADQGKGLVTRDNFDNSTYIAWLGINKPIFYYYLATPEYVLLNDTLQHQLDDIYNWVESYPGQTNISQINNDLPFIISARAMKDLSVIDKYPTENSERLVESGGVYEVVNDINERIADIDTIRHNSKNVVYGSETGTNIYLDDAYDTNLVELEVDGICEQETTSGKNLLHLKDGTYTQNGITATVNNGGIILNGTATANSFVTIPLNTNLRLVSGQYTISTNNEIANSNVRFRIEAQGTLDTSLNAINKTNTITYNNETLYGNQILIRVQSGTTLSNFKIKPMIEKGSTATEYESYTGGQPSPSPDYPQEIKTITGSLSVTSCNKNVFKITSPLKHYTASGVDISINDNVITLNGTATRAMWPDFIWGIYNNTLPRNKCKYYFSEQLEDYTATINVLSGTATDSSFFIVANDDSSSTFSFNLKNLQGSITRKANGVNRAYLSRIEKGTKFDNFTFEIMLEKGSVATAFERHIESQIQANLPEGEFIGKLDDTYKDTLNIVYKADGQYHLILNKMIGKVVLDGSETWSKLNLTFYTVIKWGKPNAICTHFTNNGSDWASNNEELKGKFTTTNVDNQFKCMLLSDMTLDDFKTWLSTHNTEVYYALATPYEVDLGIVDITLFNGINHISNSEDANMSITYVKDINIVINKLTNAVVSLGGNV